MLSVRDRAIARMLTAASRTFTLCFGGIFAQATVRETKLPLRADVNSVSRSLPCTRRKLLHTHQAFAMARCSSAC